MNAEISQQMDPKREAILAAAFTQFSRYGFKKTAMADIAKEMGISRASLYSYFDNKDEIFRTLSGSVHEEAMAAAEAHLKNDRLGLEERVESAMLARLAPFHEVVSQSPHGGELYDENSRLCGDLVQDSYDRFQDLLTSTLEAAERSGEIDLKGTDLTARAVAELLQLGGNGQKFGTSDLDVFAKRLHGFVKVFFAGLR